ncbi:LysE family translocator [Microvirga pudoricolor]|uniref:LysE family translocator n=1 Tax=Microvirga pudoricolor TaxID=2778729 RepID=UPI0019527015|nr:LysE family transporter [Microvirga pudoricolor]MBM6593191.1 LysE family transporter [Microvirga pudoricolor]
MSGFATTLMSGIIVGLMVAVPIGPMGLLCIQRTLGYGLSAGLATGFGAATVHVVFGAAVALGLDALLETWSRGSAPWLSVISAGILIWFSTRMLRRSVAVETPKAQKGEWVRHYVSALAYSLTNPLMILLFAAALPAVTLPGHHLMPLPLTIGVFIGSATWWIVLSSGVAAARNYVSNRFLNLTNKTAGLIFAVLGATMLASTVQRLMWS